MGEEKEKKDSNKTYRRMMAIPLGMILVTGLSFVTGLTEFKRINPVYESEKASLDNAYQAKRDSLENAYQFELRNLEEKVEEFLPLGNN